MLKTKDSGSPSKGDPMLLSSYSTDAADIYLLYQLRECSDHNVQQPALSTATNKSLLNQTYSERTKLIYVL